jgi:uncharacterized protein
MRLSKERLATLSKSLAESLLAEKVITFSQKKELLAAKIESILLDDLQVEDRLNAEVKEILRKYDKEIDKGEVDSQKMFQMIKKQLAKERNLIL